MSSGERYVPPLSLLDVLEGLAESGDPEGEIGDVLLSLAHGDRHEIEDALVRYADDERLTKEDRSLVGEVLVDVWSNRAALTWERFDSLSGPARAGASSYLPPELALKEAVQCLDALLGAEVYNEQSIEAALWGIRKIRGPSRDRVLAGLVADKRLARDHRILVAGFVEYTQRYRAAPGEIEPE